MRSSCGVYVDAGYLIASAATRLTGSSLRNGVIVDYRKLVHGLIVEAEKLAQLAVLRVNWYDAAENGLPDQVQDGIGMLPKVKLRLGRFGFEGQQKGVDLRIGLDLVAHARNGAVDTMVLVSGDDDLTEAVEEVQMHGVQVVVLAVPDRDGHPYAISRHLRRAADDLEVLDPGLIDLTVRRPTQPITRAVPVPTKTHPTPGPVSVPVPPRPVPEVVAYSSRTGATPVVADEYAHTAEEITTAIDTVVGKAWDAFQASAPPMELAAVERARPSIPRELDRALLLDLSRALDIENLSDPMRYQLRDRFWEIVDGRRAAS